uniref:Uncharacterized protein n=1 Tax=Cannabis sativa TaxID=3483 RepID=A0A803P4L9_CANSA
MAPELIIPTSAHFSGLDRVEFQDSVQRLDRIEAEHKCLSTCQAQLKEAYQASHLELKDGQNLIMEQLRVILSTIHNRSGADARPQSPLMEDVDVMLDDYDPYVAENTSTLGGATNISIVESQSQGERAIILSTYVVGIIHGAWKTHKGPKADFKWEDDVLNYCRGVKDQFYPKWRKNDYLYFMLNLPTNSHWVAVEVDIEL